VLSRFAFNTVVARAAPATKPMAVSSASQFAVVEMACAEEIACAEERGGNHLACESEGAGCGHEVDDGREA
jgi:hypothetical protein